MINKAETLHILPSPIRSIFSKIKTYRIWIMKRTLLLLIAGSLLLFGTSCSNNPQPKEGKEYVKVEKGILIFHRFDIIVWRINTWSYFEKSVVTIWESCEFLRFAVAILSNNSCATQGNEKSWIIDRIARNQWNCDINQTSDIWFEWCRLFDLVSTYYYSGT